MPLSFSQIQDFDALRLKIASPETILSWSYGEVTKPETINYRTQKPEKDGLFDERIFGPTKDWECYCGKYKKIKYKGIICDKCGVEVTQSLVRRERMGHIQLAYPVSHIWFLRSVPSRIGLCLDLSIQSLEKVIYFSHFIVTDVNEEAKKEALESLRKEFKAKQKSLVAELKEILTKSGIDKIEITDLVFQQKEEGGLLKQFPEEVGKEVKIQLKKIQELEDEFKIKEKELKDLVVKAILTENAYYDLSLRWGHIFDADIGASAIYTLLKKIDFDKEIPELEAELKGKPISHLAKSSSENISDDISDNREDSTNEKSRAIPVARYAKIIRRLKLLKSLNNQNIRPEWMILTVIPVIPPDLRPMVALDGGRYATSDLNDLYRRIINRNNRLKRLMELNAPEVICRNERRMLQEAVDALIDNSARQVKGGAAAAAKHELRSLATILKGKQGRFRQNLLGKRVDYSGRSVIVVNPQLKIDQCGLPKGMALELFRPFVISRLIAAGFVHNIKSANRFIESDRAEVWDTLEEIIKGAVVLLNRAPTLHRLGIQAFHPVLVEGKAIQIHPSVCVAFNADFDGDQMAVHVPLTEDAKKEANERMLSSRNLLKPATGQPIVTPNKDIAWGVYFMTIMDKNPKSEIQNSKHLKAFTDEKEALAHYILGKISLHEPIKVRFRGELMETTVGRIIFWQKIPLEIPFRNEVLNVKKLGEIIKMCLDYCGPEKTVKIIDEIKEIGFHYITQSGYTWSLEEIPDLPEKNKIIEEADKEIEKIESLYEEGLLTLREKYNKIVSLWEEVKDRIMHLCKEKLDKDGSVYTMIDSGARGSWGQLTQMMGMKGLVVNPAGNVIELPVKRSFKEGLDVLEYFISTHGTRKGLADIALRTASSGYSTRRLVDVAQDVVIRMSDCGTSHGIIVTKEESEDLGINFIERLIGRYLAADLKDSNGKVVLKKGSLVTHEIGRQLASYDIKEAKIRSPLTCEAKKGLCSKCYGYDLAYNKVVEEGTPVGIIAAQSIGEPGTQLTMRTFHTGGVAGLDITQGLPRVEELFEARPPKHPAIVTDTDGEVRVKDIDKFHKGTILSQRIVEVVKEGSEEFTYRVGKEDKIKVKDGDKVKEGEVIIERKDGKFVTAKKSGIVSISEAKSKKGNPLFVKITWKGLVVKEYIVPPGYVLCVKNGDRVTPGDPLTEGSLNLQELYYFKGKEAVQKYVLHNVQKIYSSQGQRLNDKHIEVIIRQMFSRVFVEDPGDTNLLPGEIVEKWYFDEENERIGKTGGAKAKGEDLFMGISRVSLSSMSFLSAASFQETARVLINAAVTGRLDRLEGLKENVIIGRLIPAGTGYKPKK